MPARGFSRLALVRGCIDGVVLDQLTGPADRRMSRADLLVVATALVRAALDPT